MGTIPGVVNGLSVPHHHRPTPEPRNVSPKLETGSSSRLVSIKRADWAGSRQKPMAQACRVGCKSSVKGLFTELWVGGMKGSQRGMVRHGRAMTSPGLQGGPGSAHWATGSWRHGCGCFCGGGHLTARRHPGKAGNLCPPVIQPAGSQDGQHSPPLLLPFDRLPVPLAGGTTLEPEGKEALRSLAGHRAPGEGEGPSELSSRVPG